MHNLTVVSSTGVSTGVGQVSWKSVVTSPDAPTPDRSLSDPPKNPGTVWSELLVTRKNHGPVWSPLLTETEEEGWDGRSGDEGQSEEGLVMETSGTSVRQDTMRERWRCHCVTVDPPGGMVFPYQFIIKSMTHI